MKHLDFVALYALVLMPMGAIIFTDFYFSKRAGFASNYAEKVNSGFNVAAALTWVLTLSICLGLNLFANVEIFFLGLPGWFIAVILYVVFSKVFQRQTVTQLT